MEEEETEAVDFSAYNLESVGEKGLPVWGFRLIQFLDEKGRLRTAWKIDGDVEASDLIGKLEMVKMRVFIEDSGEFDHFLTEDDCEDNDDDDDDDED